MGVFRYLLRVALPTGQDVPQLDDSVNPSRGIVLFTEGQM